MLTREEARRHAATAQSLATFHLQVVESLKAGTYEDEEEPFMVESALHAPLMARNAAWHAVLLAARSAGFPAESLRQVAEARGRLPEDLVEAARLLLSVSRHADELAEKAKPRPEGITLEEALEAAEKHGVKVSEAIILATRKVMTALAELELLQGRRRPAPAG